MSPSARRILIPIIVSLLAIAIVLVGALSRGSSSGGGGTPNGPAPAVVEGDDEGGGEAGGATGRVADATGTAESGRAATADTPPPTEAADAGTDVAPPDEAAPAGRTPGDGADRPPVEGLRAVAPDTGVRGHDVPPQTLGSTDPTVASALVEFSRAGAGISRITFSNIWQTARAGHQADAYYRQLRAGGLPTVSPPPHDQRYVLIETRPLRNPFRGAGLDVPALAASQIVVEGATVNLFDYNRDDDGNVVYIWAETGPGAFETVIVDGAGTPVLRISRHFRLGTGFDLTIEQRLENLTRRPLDVRWAQFGPSSLALDRSRYMDRRRFRFGYLPDPVQDPDRILVLADDNDLLLEFTDLSKRWKKAGEAAQRGDLEAQRELLSLWPNRTSLARDYELAWFGSTNRYFGLAVHPILDAEGRGDRALTSIFSSITEELSDPDAGRNGTDDIVVFTTLTSPAHVIEAGATLALDLGVYAGPLDRRVLEKEPYRALAMHKLILYQMSSFCAICTFQWLAHLLLGFLTLLHDHVVFDWGIAIICLVIVVRTLLHPITKKSQISMQRFGKQMGSMKPELDKLQKKFPNDAKKLQQEQMRLMREHGINPLQMLGCLPLFLQTPIWIALYAMLYFAFDLRQEPAFFGLFQTLTNGAWPFLADLSAADHFFGEVAEPFKFFLWNVTGINVLPLLMGVIFFVQQKYMSPPPSPTMTPEQLRQQQIMKIMMVVMFPLMLYSAPSGLTLYILTSSSVGILESRYIRRHITDMDLKPPPAKKKSRPKTKPKDPQGRAYAAALERREAARREKQRGPAKKYKKKKK